LIVEDISNPFFARLARVVEHEADKSGYTVMFCSTENNDEKASSLLYMLRHRQMDGFILVPTPGMKKDIQEMIVEQKPVVLVDRYFPDLDTCYVAVDNFNGAHEGVRLLLKKGFKKIGLVTVDSIQVQMQERERGFVSALEKKNGKADADQILRVPYDMSERKTVELIFEFIKKEKGLDALFFTTNYLGVAGLEALRMAGKKIPSDMGVVCFDDNDLFRLGSPSISVIAQPISTIAEKAVALLLGKLTGKEDPGGCHLIISPSVVEREST
jgi:LacI family transcriptional regulator